MTNAGSKHIPVNQLVGHIAGVLADVEQGHEVTVTRDGVAIARIVPITDSLPGAREPLVRESVATYAPAPAITSTALLRLVSTPALRAVLGVYLTNPALSLHQREIARRADIGLRSAQLALKRLVDVGLLRADRDGNRLYYHVVRSERFDELRRLMSRELGVAEVIKRHFDRVPARIELAFIFGSLATGSDVLTSDIDLLVVSDATADELVGPVADAQRELGREIDLLHYRVADFRRRREEGNHFIESILAGPRIEIVGEADGA
jgi:prevent-host-death family protein